VRPWSIVGWIVLIGLTMTAPGCRRRARTDEPAPAVSANLPPLALRDDTPNLLLTWVDDKGDFHVCQKIAEVPEAARATVRVVVTDREAGTGQQVYVADLRNKSSGGSYPVRTMSRSDWEEVGAGKRQSRLEKLAPSALASRAPASSASAAPAGASVVVYGADWCKACRDAERYLRQRGVDVVHKNIEESPAAQAEMKEKLKRAGLPLTAQIPVLDVAGEIQLGFSPAAIDRALERARSTRGL
jgi:glutaredoxin